ncbi:MAG: GyrI-like domain-containing protein [Bacteroidia bacterium]
MKVFKITGITLLIIILLAFAGAFFLPSTVHVERSKEMKAKASSVFSLLNDLKKWEQWSPWMALDSNSEIVYSEPAEGVGAWYTWKSKKRDVGEGKLTIIQSNTNSFIHCEMNFGIMGISTGSFKIDSLAKGVKVTWSMDGDGRGIPWYFYVVSKYLYLLMDKNVGPAFEKGLLKMRTIAEAIPQKETLAGFDVEIKRLEELPVLSIREKVKDNEIGKKIGQNYGAIGKYMNEKGIRITSSPLIILHSMDKEECEIEFAIPVDSNAKGAGKINFSLLPSINALVVKYYGAYDKTKPVYESAQKFIESKGKKSAGPPREVYRTDPVMEKDTSKWLTEIVFPVE